MNLDQLLTRFRSSGCDRILTKPLSANDNSKNQIYFGPDFQAINLLPHRPVCPDGRRFKAPLDIQWLDDHWNESPAPHAQLILYPQYPEVRFSGFLKGSSGAPSSLLTSRMPGRFLVLGIGSSSRIHAYACGPDSPVARELSELIESGRTTRLGVFEELPTNASASDPFDSLLLALGLLHRKGWVGGQILRADGRVNSTNAANACGYTLEAQLGISANSVAEPDFMGWELKSLTVKRLGSVPSGHRMTLMTPETKAGFYRDHGVLEFVRRYGYPDKRGIKDRLNFGGQFRVGQREPNTGLTLALDGFSHNGRFWEIHDPSGGLTLQDDDGNIAAMWPFAELISHWNRKHARAAYVPAERRIVDGRRQFRFDRQVFLGVQTDFLRFLGSMQDGKIVYDPGIKVEYNSQRKPNTKRRSQFRTRFDDLDRLYTTFRVEPVRLPAT